MDDYLGKGACLAEWPMTTSIRDTKGNQSLTKALN